MNTLGGSQVSAFTVLFILGFCQDCIIAICYTEMQPVHILLEPIYMEPTHILYKPNKKIADMLDPIETNSQTPCRHIMNRICKNK